MQQMNEDLKDFLQDLIRNEVLGVDTKTAQALLDSLDNTLYYEEVIEHDVKTTLREHFKYGEASIEQFWKLEGEAICSGVYTELTETLNTKATAYTNIIGSEL